MTSPPTPTNLTLLHPTDEEQVAIWAQGYAEWGSHLTPTQYEARERHLMSTSLLRSGGLTPWMLTSSEGGEGNRTALASCETLRKRAFVRVGSGEVKLVRAEGVASVFVEPRFRRRGYAARMMGLLASALKDREDVAFSVLYSDIGREFYARLGWRVHPSCHVSLCVPPSPSPSPSTSEAKPVEDEGDDDGGRVTAITDNQLPSLAEQDELRLRSKLSSYPASPTIRLALIPDLATLQWHFARQDFLADYIDSLPRLPGEPMRGALYEGNDEKDGEKCRVWVLWTVKSEPSDSEAGEGSKSSSNKLEFLRLSYPESISQPQLQAAVKALIKGALSQSRRWLCTSIQIWNPDERLRPILEGMTQLRPELVEREDSSIASLLWLGQDGLGGECLEAVEEKKGEKGVDVDWIANDKFGWC
ncbi:hypothetical protein CP532_3004 [Ophiocordyceps camponoti-leonardi (nom. inval.)]|nr:hypothetical protein CP532_3004 [Ophiocordyceps camponoti-leonardi (nom. inval.)]